MVISRSAVLPQQQCRRCLNTTFHPLCYTPRQSTTRLPVSAQNLNLGIIHVCESLAGAATSADVWFRARRRHSAAVVFSTRDVPTPKPADEADFADDGLELYDEWEDEFEDEFEEGKYEEGDEGEAEAEQQSVAPGAAAAAAAGSVKQIPSGQQSVQYSPDDFVDVGHVSRAHGIKGEVKVVLITDQPKKRLGASGRRLWLQRGAQGKAGAAAVGSDTVLQRVTVQWGRQVRPASKDRAAEWAVKFNEVPDRDQAENLAGCKLLLALCDREQAPRARDEFFITDLVGLKALDSATQQLMGIVTEVYDNSANYSLLRVRLAPNEADVQQSKFRSILVPFVQEMVPTVDVAAGHLELQLPEGLLETATTRKLRRPYTTEQQAQLRMQLKQRQQQQGPLQQS